MAYPVLPITPSANSFFDHMSTLDTSKWATVTSGTGSVSNTDSYEQLTAPANSASFMYYKTQLDKTKSQLWQVAFSSSTGPGGGFSPYTLGLVNGASAPAADTHTNIVAKTLARQSVSVGSGGANTLPAEFWSSGGTQTFWNNNTQAWTTSFPGANDFFTVAREDDYYICGLEIDGVNSQWRFIVWGCTYATAGTYQFNQGWRIFGISDWTTWANTRASSNIWLTIGTLWTDGSTASTNRVEWVRYIEAPSGNGVIDGFLAAKDAGTSNHTIRRCYSYDAKLWIPPDRTTDTIALGAGGTWDHDEINEPFCVYDGSTTDYLFYTGSLSGTQAIGYATATHASPQTNAFTKFGSNPVLQVGSSGANDDTQVGFACVVKDTSVGAPFAWNMLYSGKKASDGKWRTLWATASSPSGTWTKQGTVIDVGAGGSNDASTARDPTVVRSGGQWVVFYAGEDASNNYHLMYASGSSFGSLVKGGTLYSPNPSVTDQALTATLNTAPGRSVTVGASSGFSVDAAVMLAQDTGAGTWAYSKIRKIPDSTHIELYHGLTGMTTTTPARIKQIDATQNFSPRSIFWNASTSEWWYYINFWEPFFQSPDGASYGGILEEAHLFKLANVSVLGGTPTISYLDSPISSRGQWSNSASFENITTVNIAFTGDAPSGGFFNLMRA